MMRASIATSAVRLAILMCPKPAVLSAATILSAETFSGRNFLNILEEIGPSATD